MWLIDNYLAHFFLILNQYKPNGAIVLFSQLFDNSLVFFLMGLFVAFKRKVVKKFILFFIIVTIIIFTTKYLVSRQRPFAMLGIKNTLHLNSNASFPSAHTGYSILFALFIQNYEKKQTIKIIFWILAFLISISRIIILAHYFSDVILTIIFIVIFYYLFERLWFKYYEKYKK